MPTWKLAGMYKIDRKTSIRANYASGFRAPSLKELYMDFFMGNIFMIYGNENLKCEKNHNFSVAFENYGSISDNLKYCFTATGYYNLFDNYITTATVQRDGAYGQQYTNVADQRIAGADASLQLHHHNGLGAKLSYAFTKSYTDDDQPDLTSARPHSLTWRLDYDHTFNKNFGLNAALSGRFLSSVDVAEYSNLSELSDFTYNHYEGYQMWKLNLSLRFMKGINVNLAVDNLFDYQPSSYYANSPTTIGRTVTAGLSIDIDKFFK
jgi:outer membrane receptor for ferrienterochelin and colicins